MHSSSYLVDTSADSDSLQCLPAHTYVWLAHFYVMSCNDGWRKLWQKTKVFITRWNWISLCKFYCESGHDGTFQGTQTIHCYIIYRHSEVTGSETTYDLIWNFEYLRLKLSAVSHWDTDFVMQIVFTPLPIACSCILTAVLSGLQL